MQDREIVEGIVAGEPAALASAYTRYARVLHAYCHSLLGQAADAADAVQDTFIITAAKVGGLRDPDRLRPWLYAVARNECRRRLRERSSAAALEEAGEVSDDGADVTGGAEQRELRALVRDALAGLNAGEREVIELNLRHDLDGAELAASLGVSRNQAHALASRARSQFEVSLGALLVARAGRDACADLDLILEGWDGELTPLLRKRVNRHLQSCRICTERKRQELTPAMLLGLLPVLELPPGLREQVLRLVADTGPEETGYRATVVERAGPFRASGFPAPLDPPRFRLRQGGPVLAAAVGVVLFAVIGGGVVFASDILPHGPSVSGAAGNSKLAATNSATPSTVPAVPSVAPLRTSPEHSAPATKASSPPVLQPTPTVSPTPKPPKPPAPPKRTPPPTPTPPEGTPVPSPDEIRLVPQTGTTVYSGSFEVTAEGGPITGFHIGSTAPAGDLVFDFPSGTISSGQTIQVVVRVANSAGMVFANWLTLLPGSDEVEVFYPPAG